MTVLVLCMLLQIAQETAVCPNPNNPSNWESCTTRQNGYKHIFCQNVLSTSKWLVLIFTL